MQPDCHLARLVAQKGADVRVDGIAVDTRNLQTLLPGELRNLVVGLRQHSPRKRKHDVCLALLPSIQKAEGDLFTVAQQVNIKRVAPVFLLQRTEKPRETVVN